MHANLYKKTLDNWVHFCHPWEHVKWALLQKSLIKLEILQPKEHFWWSLTMKNDAIEKMIDSRIYMFITGEIVLVQPLLWGENLPPPPPLCVQIDFTQTFEAKAKCNNINHV